MEVIATSSGVHNLSVASAEDRALRGDAAATRKKKYNNAAPAVGADVMGYNQASFTLLTRLVERMTEYEQWQERFRMAVSFQLARMETTLSLLLLRQQIQMQNQRPQFYEDKLREDAARADEFISQQSKAAGMKVIRYTYGADAEGKPRYDGRQRWSGWKKSRHATPIRPL